MVWPTGCFKKHRKSSGKKKVKNKNVKSKQFEIFAFCFFSTLLLSGCPNSNDALLRDQIRELTDQNTQLTGLLDESRSENQQLKKQVQVLTELPEEVKAENLYTVDKVKVHRYTGLYDDDKDGKIDTLIVCIQPIDNEGDVVKATGVVEVQLWDLNKADGEALLGKWHVEPEELKERWVALLVINYRLKFDITNIINPDTSLEEPLTVKVTFTDYLSGKVFNEQKVIKPKAL
jgi:hypothetical protein